MKRETFLSEFLGALGAESISYAKIDNDYISGTVHYAPSENCVFEEEVEDLRQDFCWHMTEDNVPKNEVLNLVKLINRERLLDIDKLILTPEELREKYNVSYESDFCQEEFNSVLAE